MSHFGSSWGHLGSFGRYLGPSWARPSWGYPETILGHLEAILGHLGAISSYLGTILVPKASTYPPARFAPRVASPFRSISDHISKAISWSFSAGKFLGSFWDGLWTMSSEKTSLGNVGNHFQLKMGSTSRPFFERLLEAPGPFLEPSWLPWGSLGRPGVPKTF